jgi:hypothetical protein
MICYNNLLKIMFIISLVLSISPISAYSIETQTHNNNTFDMNVLTQPNLMGLIPSSENSNKEDSLEVNTIGNETHENFLSFAT